MDRIDRAVALADRLVAGDHLAPRPAVGFRRTVAIGDLQASARRIFAVLDHHRLLADDGRLADDVQLISIGDHFDYGTRTEGCLDQARVDGCRVLAWLAAHDPEQVIILLGNHDTARVMELAAVSDARFAAAAPLAAELVALKKADRAAFDQRLAGEYTPAFPELPTPGLVHRDFSAFTEAQRALVGGLVLSGRMRLAATARTRDGTPLLLTHAGITTRELDLLSLDGERAPAAIAAVLGRYLGDAVDQVRADWSAGRMTPLSLAPLHVAGATGADRLGHLPEGGGMLYHRPADPDRPGADRSWENERTRPRRFHPRRLPAGLVQVAGHTGHPKCVEELIRWRDPDLPEVPAGLRSLRVRDGDIRYQLGELTPAPGDALLYMIDPSLHKAGRADVDVLELAPGSAA